MLAFVDTPITPDQAVAAVQRHYDADAIVSGTYGEERNGKWVGCAVGCTLHDFGVEPGNHAAAERLFGIPEVLMQLEDSIFEALPDLQKKEWPLRFIKACAAKAGTDLSSVWPRFAHWMLVDPEDGVIKFQRDDPIGYEAIARVGALFARQITGDNPTLDEWDASAESAENAAWAEYVVRATIASSAAWAKWAARAARAANIASAASAATAEKQAEVLISFINAA